MPRFPSLISDNSINNIKTCLNEVTTGSFRNKALATPTKTNNTRTRWLARANSGTKSLCLCFSTGFVWIRRLGWLVRRLFHWKRWWYACVEYHISLKKKETYFFRINDGILSEKNISNEYKYLTFPRAKKKQVSFNKYFFNTIVSAN